MVHRDASHLKNGCHWQNYLQSLTLSITAVNGDLVENENGTEAARADGDVNIEKPMTVCFSYKNIWI